MAEGEKYQLTLEAEKAIRIYLYKFAIPAALILTTFSGALGYVVSGLSRIDANTEASKALNTALQSTAEARANAAQAAQDATALRKRVEDAATNAESTSTKLSAAREQIEKAIGGQYEAIAKSLVASPGFRDSLAKVSEDKIKQIDEKITLFDRVLFDAPTTAVPSPGNNCPLGTFAFAISSVSVSGGRAGFLESVSVSCRSLRFERPVVAPAQK